jgi:methionyl-tRNA synthetase
MKNYHCFVCKNNPVQKETSHFFIDLPAIQKELEEWIDKASVTG